MAVDGIVRDILQARCITLIFKLRFVGLEGPGPRELPVASEAAERRGPNGQVIIKSARAAYLRVYQDVRPRTPGPNCVPSAECSPERVLRGAT